MVHQFFTCPKIKRRLHEGRSDPISMTSPLDGTRNAIAGPRPDGKSVLWLIAVAGSSDGA
jgi:hypothetical protein